MAEDGPASQSPVTDDVAALQITDEEALEGVYTEQQHKYSQRTLIKTILSSGTTLAEKKLVVGGWVKTGRVAGAGAFGFLELNDGSCASSLQVIIDKAVYPLAKLTATGTSVTVVGTLSKTPEGTKQVVELRATKILHLGASEPATYPIAKTKLSLEYLRSVQHLRARTNTISAVARIRSSLAFATHKFFNEHGFMYIHTPLITTSDAEGAGELFQVTTLLSKVSEPQEPPPTEEEIAAAEAAVTEKGDQVRVLKEKKEKSKVKRAVAELTELKEKVEELKKRARVVGGLLRKEDGAVDYGEDFFGRQAFLTVSGQLQVETYAMALSNVYTFGPTFRAENSNTTRHLAEFWMIEPEIAFADLKDDMQLAEDYVRYLCQYLLDHCGEDLELMRKLYDKTCIDRLTAVASTPFGRVSYTEAIEILLKVKKEDKEFENKVEWGIDLASEHERYLAEVHFQKPVVVYNYPKDIKAFYMRLNDDGKTVAAMDVLVPGVGELVGGSQREERLEVLEQRLQEMGLPREPYEWYLETRKYGTVKHAGFGLGFERMILFATGMENIRDVIPFPRYPGRADL